MSFPLRIFGALALTMVLAPRAGQATSRYMPVRGYTAASNIGSGSDKVLIVAVGVTPDGGFAALASRNTETNSAYQVIKIGPAGNLEWQADLYGSLGIQNAFAHDLAVHSSGRIFVTGGISGGASPSGSVFVAEFTSAGAYAGVSFSQPPLSIGSVGRTLRISGDSLYVGGEDGGGSAGHLARFDIASGRVFKWSTVIADPVLGIAKIGSSVFVSGRQTFSGGNGWLRSLYETSDTSVSGVLMTRSGGGRVHVGPDGLLYVASSRPTPGQSGSNFGMGRISVINPATGAISVLEASLPLQGNSTGGDQTCCASVQQVVDFGFSGDGTLLVAWDGSDGPVSLGYNAGLAGYARQVELCGGSGDCSNWIHQWTQPALSPYFNKSNVEVRSLAMSGTYAIVGANSESCVSTSSGCTDQFGVVVLDVALDSNPPAKGVMQVRRNVMNMSRGDEAVVVLNGNPYGWVKLMVFGPSGNVVAGLRGSDCDPAPGETCEVRLDSQGKAAITFDGKYNSETPLRSGMYWIVASGGGISDRKPVIIKAP